MFDLIELGIIKQSASGNAYKVFEKHFENLTLDTYQESKTLPSQFISKNWTSLKSGQNVDRGSLGKYFEYLIALTLYLEGIAPFYTYAIVPLVPNVEFDLLMYEQDRGPIVLSIKTSLRERYKQADLEALALKTVFKKAVTYVITMEANEAAVQQAKLERGEMHALEEFVLATSPKFDSFIENLRRRNLIEAPSFPLVRDASRVVPFHGAF